MLSQWKDLRSAETLLNIGAIASRGQVRTLCVGGSANVILCTRLVRNFLQRSFLDLRFGIKLCWNGRNDLIAILVAYYIAELRKQRLH